MLPNGNPCLALLARGAAHGCEPRIACGKGKMTVSAKKSMPDRRGKRLSSGQSRGQDGSSRPTKGGKVPPEDVGELLATLAPFSRLDEQTCRAVAAQTMTMRVPRRTTIFAQGEVPNAQVIVLEGTVHLSGSSNGGPEMLVETVTAPDLLLPAAILEDAPYLLRAQAATECRLLLIPAETLRRLVSTEPSVALGVIACLTKQFRRMTRQVKTLKLRTTTQRVAAYLLALAESENGQEIVLPYDKGTIAAELGMTRESLSRAFASLEANAIFVTGNKVTIRDRQKLQDYCPRDQLIDSEV